MLSTITQLGAVLCFIFANGTIPTYTCGTNIKSDKVACYDGNACKSQKSHDGTQNDASAKMINSAKLLFMGTHK